MKNIKAKIVEYYPMSDEALEAMLGSMTPMQCPKNTLLVCSGITDRNVYFIEEGVTRSIFHKDGTDTTTWFSMEGGHHIRDALTLPQQAVGGECGDAYRLPNIQDSH